jgi:hypothetical protein
MPSTRTYAQVTALVAALVLLVLLAIAAAPLGLDAVRYHHRGPTLFRATLKADSWFTRAVHREEYLLAIRHAEHCLDLDPKRPAATARWASRWPGSASATGPFGPTGRT